MDARVREVAGGYDRTAKYSTHELPVFVRAIDIKVMIIPRYFIIMNTNAIMHRIRNLQEIFRTYSHDFNSIPSYIIKPFIKM